MNQASILDPANDEFEDHGRGLVFDLVTLDRRRVLKLRGFGGVSAGLFTIAGCGPAGATGSVSGTAGGGAPCRGGELRDHPRGDRRTVPGDGSMAPCADRERRGPKRHHRELPLVDKRTEEVVVSQPCAKRSDRWRQSVPVHMPCWSAAIADGCFDPDTGQRVGSAQPSLELLHDIRGGIRVGKIDPQDESRVLAERAIPICVAHESNARGQGSLRRRGLDRLLQTCPFGVPGP